MKDNKNEMSAMAALEWANFIAVSPFVFQAVKSLIDLGILSKLGELKKGETLTKEALCKSLNFKEYVVSVLLDLALKAKVINGDEQNGFYLSKVGVFLLDDPMTKVNFNFTADVCYEGLKDLTSSLQEERPVGLEVFTKDHKTIYPFISSLPPKAKESWFAFDHFYSDHSFLDIINKIFSYKDADKVAKVYDVGGNTGKFAKLLVDTKDVNVGIVDLKEQCALVENSIKDTYYESKITTHPVNILSENIAQSLPHDGDVWFMSQFLDCFSKEQIEYILKSVYSAMPEKSMLVINEVFGDCQANDIASLVIEANSLYFTALANGVSRFYHASEFLSILSNTGFKLIEQINALKMGHTVLILEK